MSAWAAGSVDTLEAASGLRNFGGLEYVPRIAALTALREIGPAAGPGAAIIAMIAWAHKVGPSVVSLHHRKLYARSTVAALVGFPIAATIATASSSALLLFAPISVSQFWDAAVKTARPSDLAAGVGLTMLYAVVALSVAWFGLVPLTRTPLKLPSKILATWLILVLMKVLLGSVMALALNSLQQKQLKP